MTCRGFNHEATGRALCPAGLDYQSYVRVRPLYVPESSRHTRSRVKIALRDHELVVKGDQWPIFLYRGYNFNPDAPWDGLLQGQLLLNVCLMCLLPLSLLMHK